MVLCSVCTKNRHCNSFSSHIKPYFHEKMLYKICLQNKPYIKGYLERYFDPCLRSTVEASRRRGGCAINQENKIKKNYANQINLYAYI